MKTPYIRLCAAFALFVAAGTGTCFGLMVGLDHMSAGRTTLLWLLFPSFLSLAAFALSHACLGVLPKRRELFNGIFAGPVWRLDALRFLAPLLAVAGIYVCVALACRTGVYWWAQMTWHTWPPLPHANMYAMQAFLLSAWTIWQELGVAVSILLLYTALNAKCDRPWLARALCATGLVMLAWRFLLVFCTINTPDRAQWCSLVLTFMPLIAFAWFCVFRPRRPSSLKPWDWINHALFCALVVGHGMLWEPSLGAWLKLHTAIPLALVLAVMAWYRAGWCAALLALPMGLTPATALWFFVVLPDSAWCTCQACGARTRTLRAACPACHAPLRYRMLVPWRDLLDHVRIATLVALGIAVCAVYMTAVFIATAIADGRSPSIAPIFVLDAATLYSVSNVVICNAGRVVGTNQAVIAQDSYTKYLQDRDDKEQLTPDAPWRFFIQGTPCDVLSVGGPGMNRNIVTVAPSNTLAQIANIHRRIALDDYRNATNIVASIPWTDEQLFALLCFRSRPVNRSYELACHEAFRLLWERLEAPERAARYRFYNDRKFGSSVDSLALLVRDFSPDQWRTQPPLRMYGRQSLENDTDARLWRDFFKSHSSDSLGFFHRFRALHDVTAAETVWCELFLRVPLFAIVQPWITERDQPLNTAYAAVIPRWRTQLLSWLRTPPSGGYRGLGQSVFNKYWYALMLNPTLCTPDDVLLANQHLKDEGQSGIFTSGCMMAIDQPSLWAVLPEEFPAARGINWDASFWNGSYTMHLPRAIVSTNALGKCQAWMKQSQSQEMPDAMGVVVPHLADDADGRLGCEVLQKYPDQLKHVVQGDGINRAIILRRCVATAELVKILGARNLAQQIYDYPFPDAAAALRTLATQCEENDRNDIGRWADELKNLGKINDASARRR